MSSRVAIATVLALATALFYAISNVLELLEAEQVPDEFAMRPTLLMRLIKRPRWLLGLLSDFGGYICHAAALGLATVVFVEPILATGILMSLFIGSAFVHRPVPPLYYKLAANRLVGQRKSRTIDQILRPITHFAAQDRSCGD